jgi:hypothetical protein
MGALKTTRTRASVDVFLKRLPETRRAECLTVLRIMKRATGAPPAMWGSSIVGFGSYQYSNRSGRGGEWFLTGFSPRKHALTFYIMAGFNRYQDLMRELGTYSTGVSCLYVKHLDDIDLAVFRKLVEGSVARMKRST